MQRPRKHERRAAMAISIVGFVRSIPARCCLSLRLRSSQTPHEHRQPLRQSFAAIALRQAPAPAARLVGWAGAVLAGVALFFIALLLSPADPFARLADVPNDGSGLNPLLQSPGMLIHPPLLYLGFRLAAAGAGMVLYVRPQS